MSENLLAGRKAGRTGSVGNIIDPNSIMHVLSANGHEGNNLKQ